MRLQVSNGAIGADGTASTNLLVTAAEFTPYPPEYYEKGVRVALTDFRQNPTDPFCGHKTTCYGPRLTALKNAHEKLATEALWFTTENFLAEGSISNVFLVKDGALYTPPVQTPVLPGIARKTVLEIAEAENIPCHETPLQIGDVLGAEEIFLTNVIMEVLPVTSVEAHTVADGKPGEITKKLGEKYKIFLKVE
ncbi:MAG: aminotransferase class IV [Planctomycetota bacterium]